MDEIMDFVVCGGQSTESESSVPRSLSARTPKEIVLDCYRHLIAACNELQVFEVRDYRI